MCSSNVHRALAVCTLTEDCLEVALVVDGVEGEVVVHLDAYGLALLSALCCDEHGTVTTTVAIKSRSSSTLEHLYALDIVGADVAQTVTHIGAAICAASALVGVVERHAVDNVERHVVAGH